MATLGVELEMPVVRKDTGALHLVERYFRTLADSKRKRGEMARVSQLGGRDIAVLSPGVVNSVDNAFNNLESSLGPIPDIPRNLELLRRTIDRELHDIVSALAEENATILNLSQHPATALEEQYYLAARAPKPIYDYWVHYRNWDHKAGIDAKAHNSPTTGVTFLEAVEGLNLLLALSAVFISLYANSPFAGGRPSGFRESRLRIWPAMFKTSRFACDRKLHRMPDRPFADLKDYFTWMFGPGTHMQCIFGQGESDYKKSGNLLRVAGDPPLLEFLRRESWQASHLGTGEDGGWVSLVHPDMRYLEFLQFSHFLDVRIRYRFKRDMPVELFLQTFDGDTPLEELFAGFAEYSYLEGRAAGANFPDRELTHLDDDDVARSVVVSASALQSGLLRNRSAAWKIVRRHGWQAMVGLREVAIRDGLHGQYAGISLQRLCREALEAAAAGLDRQERWMLAYPRFVLDTGRNGADRALAAYDRASGDSAKRLRQVIAARQIVDPLPNPVSASSSIGERPVNTSLFL